MKGFSSEYPLFFTLTFSLQIRDKRRYNNTLKASTCLRGRCCAGDKNQTGPSEYTPEVKTEGREVWTGNKPKYMRHTRTQTYGKEIEIETEGMKIEEVKNVKYLRKTVTKDNLIEEEIK
jgi:hypothetical protein